MTPSRPTVEHAIVRQAATGDARALAMTHLRSSRVAYKDLIPGDPPAFDVLERDWATAVTNEDTSVFAAVLGRRVVGTVHVEPVNDAPDVGELRRLYVAPEWWLHGIGTLLHEVAVQELARRFDAAELWVLERNERARRFYERCGWQLVPGAVLDWATMPVREVRYRLALS